MAYRIYLGTANKRINSTLRWDYSGGESFDIVFKRDTDLDFPVFVLEYSGTPAWNVMYIAATSGYYWVDYSGGESFDIVFKRDTDLDFPVFVLEYSGTPAWNVMYIAATSGYYWVTNIRSVRAGVWEVSAAMDVLATFKTEILATPCYIEYGKNADASGAQTRLPDTRQNVSQVPQVFTASADITGGRINTKWGAYVLTAVGKAGGVTAYAMGAANIKALLNSVGTTIDDALKDFTSVEDILKYFTANSLAQGSAIQAIRSCVWMPVDSGVFTGDIGEVYLGDFATGASGIKLGQNPVYVHTTTMIRSCVWMPVDSGVFTGDIGEVYLGDFATGASGIKLGQNPVYVHTTTINIPWPAEDWKRMNCQMLLYLPFIGTVSVPVDQCNNVAALTVTLSLECITGGISVKVDAGSYTVYAGSGNIGVPYAIGSSNVPIQNTIAGTVSATTGALSMGGGLASVLTGNIGGGIQAMAGGTGQVVSGLMQTLQPVVQCAGTLGGSAAIGQSMQATLCLLYYAPLNDDAFQAAYGFPVMRMGTPVAGFCKTRGFSLAAPARLEELQQVAAFMDGGVFIE